MSIDKPYHISSNSLRPSSATTRSSSSYAQAGVNPHSISTISPCHVSIASNSRPRSAPTKRAPHYWRPQFTPRPRASAGGTCPDILSEIPVSSARGSGRTAVDILAPTRPCPRFTLGDREGIATQLTLLRRALNLLRGSSGGAGHDIERAVGLLGTLDLATPAAASAFILGVIDLFSTLPNQ
jgi:hypothetical protein